MSPEKLRTHRESHTKANSWWLHDAKGIPLCRVCCECLQAARECYAPEILGISGRYEDVVDEPIEEDL